MLMILLFFCDFDNVNVTEETSINDINIERVADFNLLGIQLSEDL